jgi:hypothetical protein
LTTNLQPNHSKKEDCVMSHHSSASAVDAISRALRDADTSKRTRRWFLERTALGAVGIAAAGAVVGARDARADAYHERNTDSLKEWGVFASTTEALTVTILTELVRRAGVNRVPSSVSAIFDGVYAAELDHWEFIHKLYPPGTTRFWIPDGFFGGAGDALDLKAVGKGVAGGEHLFVNTYLLGVTIAAAAGQPKLARYAAALAGVESEHRVLGQSLAGVSPPNDLGFAVFEFSTVGDIGAAAEKAGFGFGKQGTAAGRFYDFPQSPAPPTVAIKGNTPT